MVGVPLLNSYKQEFIRKRLWQTLLGGLYINLNSPTPCLVHFLEVLVWIFPWIVGGIFTVVKEVGKVDTLHCGIGVGLVICCTVFLFQILSYLAYRTYERTFGDSTQNLPTQSHQFSSSKELRRLLSEEDAVTFDSFNWFRTLFFIFVPKRYWLNIGIHSIVSGGISALVFTFLLPSNLSNIFQTTAITYTLFVLLWIVTCISQFPVITGKPVPETATYRSVDVYDIANLSRPFHIFIFLVPYIVWLVYPSSSILLLITQIFSWIFLSCPVLWFFGMLPPVDCAVIWTVEQAVVFGFGGSSCSSDLRLFLNAILSVTLYIGSSFISQLLPLLILNAILGYVLSTNVVHIFESGIQLLITLITKATSLERLDTINAIPKLDKKKQMIYVLWHLCTVVSVTLLVTLLANFRSQINTGIETRNAMEYTFIACAFVVKILHELQLVEMFGIFRNLIFPDSNYNKEKFIKRKKIVSSLSGLNTVFSGVALPLLFVTYLTLLTNTSSLPSWIEALGLLHGYRHIWQRPGNAVLNFAVMSAINVGIRSQGYTNWWTMQQPGVHLLIIDICRDRFFRLLNNIWFVSALTIKSQSDEKQRRKHRIALLSWNVLSCPLTILVCFCCAILASPVLPIFTLPLFFISFPRPSRFWPQQPGSAQASVCGDTVYYSQLTPAVVNILQDQFSSGALRNHVSFSCLEQYYLARSQDKTLWIEVLESGCGYSYINIKGLELQETSCHALEATKLDDLFTSAFEQDEGPCFDLSNFWSSVTPRDTHFISSYSDAKNSLAGILDQYDAVPKVRLYFMKALAWLLVNKTNKEPALSKQKEVIPGQITDDIPLNDLKSMSGVVKETGSQRAASALSNVLSLRSQSLDSFMSIFSTDNEDMKKPKMNTKKKIQTIDGSSFHGKQDDWDDTNSIFSDSGFGLPAQDLNTKKNGFGKFGSNVTSVFFPDDWLSSLPISENDLLLDVKLSIDWVNFCFDKLQTVERDVLKSKEVHFIASVCDAIFNVEGVPGKQTALLTDKHLAKVFNNQVPWSPAYEWLTSKPVLNKYALKAFRYAVKLVYDEVSLGEIESNSEFDEYLEEYDKKWFIGSENDPLWQSSISQNKPHLFTMGVNDKGTLHARVLSKQEVPLHVASVNSASVHGIWSDLAFELIYATNNDEERYSIQAHQSFIRNLTIQTADPPLGYPIYSSKPLSLQTYLF